MVIQNIVEEEIANFYDLQRKAANQILLSPQMKTVFTNLIPKTFKEETKITKISLNKL